MPSPVSRPLILPPIEVGIELPNFTSLKQLHDLAWEAYDLLGGRWTSMTLKDEKRAEKNLRAGFLGTVIVGKTTVLKNGEINGNINKNEERTIDGLLLQLDMEFRVTGKNTIAAMSGLAIGNSNSRFEVHAYDLTAKTFGAVAVPALEAYLARSRAAGATDRGRSAKGYTKSRKPTLSD